ncbi:hypothetical protein P154DRAFT_2890 [Amniculicola lignicola CBS 123094]|uniref:Uncharacterized protein n=1 Tax=Amniculicola lignicola CBS 123094 TaxID=1392246 RepID=A0A6A5X4J7_9PLEO|nr:hypothetical protein P154DRAFT_2890 [Amniculicola lignicola CBS 123094]
MISFQNYTVSSMHHNITPHQHIHKPMHFKKKPIHSIATPHTRLPAQVPIHAVPRQSTPTQSYITPSSHAATTQHSEENQT